MFNLKENSLLLYGEDLRDQFPVRYRPNMVDEWASFAPTYHLHRAEELAKEEDGVKACYALSRSVLQAARVVVWKDARCTSSSYEKIVSTFEGLNKSEELPGWALMARNQDFDVSLKAVRRRLEPARQFVRRTLG